MNESIYGCTAYIKLHQLVVNDSRLSNDPENDRYHKKLQWIVERAQHYAEISYISSAEVLTIWESRRDYWYMNYYQDSKQPILNSEKVRIFDTTDDLLNSLSEMKFRCPRCKGISTSPYECNSGIITIVDRDKNKPCDWKVYGLFADLGKGVHIFVKDGLRHENIFMPIEWEEKKNDRS